MRKSAPRETWHGSVRKGWRATARLQTVALTTWLRRRAVNSRVYDARALNCPAILPLRIHLLTPERARR
jgi:hypothetical protein